MQSRHPDKLVFVVESGEPHAPLAYYQNPRGAFVLTLWKPYSDWICRFEGVQSRHPDKLVFVVESGKPHAPLAYYQNPRGAFVLTL